MTIKTLKINLSKSHYYSGEIVAGTVTVELDAPKSVKAIKLVIRGEALFDESLHTRTFKDIGGKLHHKTDQYRYGEIYLIENIKLLRNETTLTSGLHTFPFAVMMPRQAPSSFTGTYGEIKYYAKAKIINPIFELNKEKVEFFRVTYLLDINNFPILKVPIKLKKSKTFCSFGCTSGPLSLTVFLPKIGYSNTEAIPITVEIDNASNVTVGNVIACLSERIKWRCKPPILIENTRLKQVIFGGVPQRTSRTYSKTLSLTDVSFSPNILGCSKISITPTLLVEAYPQGMHLTLQVKIPLMIGDTPLQNGTDQQYGNSSPVA